MDKESHTNRNGFWDQVRPGVVRQPRAQRGAHVMRAVASDGQPKLGAVCICLLSQKSPLYCLLLTDTPLGL